MQRWHRRFVRMLAGLGLAALLVTPLHAQGVTTAAVQGVVRDQGAGTPIENASVVITNNSTGQHFQTTTRNNGRYFFENVPVGGPYTIEARAIGFEPGRKTELQLALGQRYTADFALSQAVVQLDELTIAGTVDPLINSGRTGPGQTISDSAIQRLPLLGRNFTDLVVTSPQVTAPNTGGVSIGGQNNRFNNIQIDGAVNNDLFGLAASGVPGGQANSKPISLEAVQEFQILTAPYDVRQGSFAGGLVNAITKSGTNELHGSVFGYLQSQALVGRDTANLKIDDFNIKQYGGTIGGPIVRDQVHFFLSADLQERSTPFVGQDLGDPTTGFSEARADSVRTVLQNVYGFDPGSAAAPKLTNPDKNFFGKVTAQLGNNSQLEVSHNYVKASDDNLIRDSRRTGFRDGYQLSNSGYSFSSKTNSTRAKWTAMFANRFSNELLLGYSTVRDARELPNRVPLIFVAGDTAGSNIAAGSDKFSQANSLDQDILEITDNLTFGVGRHRVTVGTHNEFFKFNNVFFPASLGVWSFDSPTDLANGVATRYEIALPTAARPDGPVADFNVKQLGGYLQDQWQPTPQWTLTLGLRMDVPIMDKPVTNPALVTDLGINTGDFPSGNVLWSPRFGFNYDVRGTGETVVRGGIGVFSGRPPYVWMSNAFTNTGLEQESLVCTGAAVPTFTVDPDNQPTSCGAGGGPPVAATPTINYFDKDFKFQQNMKIALGVDHRLPWEMVGTLDFLYTKSLNQFYLQDVNIVETGRNAEGRMLYGTSNGSGGLSRATVTNNFRQVIEHSNKSRDFSTSITAQLQKRFSDNLEFSVGYTWSNTRDLMSLTSSIASSNLGFAALDGTQANRIRRRSVFDRPHKITASGTVTLPFDFRASLIYVGVSGSPFTYMVSGDANADGNFSNDIIYVPGGPGDITLSNPADYATLDAFINSQKCLRSQRGHVMARNSCRNPWSSVVNARFSKFVNTWNGQSIEVTADIFNLANLIDGDWGLQRLTSSFEGQTALRYTGYDAANGRGIYSLSLPNLDKVSINPSRWRMQLGAKYTF